jgi:hypothetical protein
VVTGAVVSAPSDHLCRKGNGRGRVESLARRTSTTVPVELWRKHVLENNVAKESVMALGLLGSSRWAVVGLTAA